MAYCIQCGTKIDDGSRFCTRCGASRAGSSAAAPTLLGSPPQPHNLIVMLGVAGSAILFLGVFAPIVSIPIAGNQNYFQNGKGDGVVLLVVAIVSLALVFAGMARYLLWSGLLALGVLASTFINFQVRMGEVRRGMESELAGNPLAGLAEMAMQSVQLQWGWAVLVIGGGLLVAAGILALRQTGPGA